MRYRWITSQEGTFSVKAMCRVLKVRRNGYYAWKRRKPGVREDQAKHLDETLRQRFEAHQGRYGSPRFTAELKAEGWRVGRPRGAKRMRALGLKARAAKKYKATTQSKHNCRWRRIGWSRILPPMHPTQSGCPISPIYGRARAGCTWPS